MRCLGVEIKNMHSLKIDEVKGDIELPTSVYGNRSITLDTLAEFIGTGGSNGVVGGMYAMIGVAEYWDNLSISPIEEVLKERAK